MTAGEKVARVIGILESKGYKETAPASSYARYFHDGRHFISVNKDGRPKLFRARKRRENEKVSIASAGRPLEGAGCGVRRERTRLRLCFDVLLRFLRQGHAAVGSILDRA